MRRTCLDTTEWSVFTIIKLLETQNRELMNHMMASLLMAAGRRNLPFNGLCNRYIHPEKVIMANSNGLTIKKQITTSTTEHP
jgi:hypothetical protein